MVERKSVLAQSDAVSTKISDLVRYISFGILAVAYSIFTSESDFAKELLRSSALVVLAMAALSACSIVFDYLQYLFGFFNSQIALGQGGDDLSYPKGLFLYGRYLFFYLKQILTMASAFLLIYSIFSEVLLLRDFL
jgi:hypothetical protein